MWIELLGWHPVLVVAGDTNCRYLQTLPTQIVTPFLMSGQFLLLMPSMSEIKFASSAIVRTINPLSCR
jgi:hypothetical protein